MLKQITFFAAFTLATVANAAPDKPISFVHDGQSYTYSVEQSAKARVLRGTHDRTGNPFVLYVTDKRVSGTVNGRYVSFKRSQVKRLNSDVQVASR